MASNLWEVLVLPAPCLEEYSKIAKNDHQIECLSQAKRKILYHLELQPLLFAKYTTFCEVTKLKTWSSMPISLRSCTQMNMIAIIYRMVFQAGL